MPEAKIGVIGGSGLYGIDGLSHIEEVPPGGGIILHHVSARVVQSDRLGNLIDAVTLVEGIRVETVD